MTSPINLFWDGEAFRPANKFWAGKCDQRFIVGQGYVMDEVHQRSLASHAHYFAELHDLFQSLPEYMAEAMPSEDHFRKHALIRTGYRSTTHHYCKTPEEAERLEAAVRPYDTYQIVEREGCIVTVHHALSQDMKSMDKKTFEESKEAVLNWCHALVGSDRQAERRAS